MEKIDFLIEYLLRERNEKLEINSLSYNDKKRIFRSLCNIREAKKSLSKEFLKIQDEYLQEELEIKGVVENIESSKISDVIYLWKGDITTLKIEAIVNAANSQGLGCFIPCHKCIDNAIHSASGIELRLECDKKMKEIGKLETGKAFITKGYNLPAKYIIHTVGPVIYNNVTKKEEKQLMDCYINSLKLAMKNGIRTIAFPCISTGEFKFPKEKASKLAISAVKSFLDEYAGGLEKVVFNVYGEEDYKIYESNFK